MKTTRFIKLLKKYPNKNWVENLKNKLYRLTDFDLQVIDLLAQGLSEKQIITLIPDKSKYSISNKVRRLSYNLQTLIENYESKLEELDKMTVYDFIKTLSFDEMKRLFIFLKTGEIDDVDSFLNSKILDNPGFINEKKDFEKLKKQQYEELKSRCKPFKISIEHAKEKIPDYYKTYLEVYEDLDGDADWKLRKKGILLKNLKAASEFCSERISGTKIPEEIVKYIFSAYGQKE